MPKDGVRRATLMTSVRACYECGFDLWLPIASVGSCQIGLYDDARFPGRLIVSLIDHYEHLEEAPAEVASAFIRDVQWSAKVLREVTRSDRVNIAVLGNQEPHVHAHLIPRIPAREPLPRHSPWADPRPITKLSSTDRFRLLEQLADRFDAVDGPQVEVAS